MKKKDKGVLSGRGHVTREDLANFDKLWEEWNTRLTNEGLPDNEFEIWPDPSKFLRLARPPLLEHQYPTSFRPIDGESLKERQAYWEKARNLSHFVEELDKLSKYLEMFEAELSYMREFMDAIDPSLLVTDNSWRRLFGHWAFSRQDCRESCSKVLQMAADGATVDEITEECGWAKNNVRKVVQWFFDNMVYQKVGGGE